MNFPLNFENISIVSSTLSWETKHLHIESKIDNTTQQQIANTILCVCGDNKYLNIFEQVASVRLLDRRHLDTAVREEIVKKLLYSFMRCSCRSALNFLVGWVFVFLRVDVSQLLTYIYI